MRFAWLLQPHKINDKIWGVRKDGTEACRVFIVYFISPTKTVYFDKKNARGEYIHGVAAVVLVAVQEFVSELSYWAAS